MWNTKSMPREPKKKKFVARRQSCPRLKMRCEL